MKVRNGFVSNSSSSSFVCIGVSVSAKEYYDNIDAINKANLDATIHANWYEDYLADEIEVYVGIVAVDGDSITLPIATLTLGKKLHAAGLVKDPLHAPLKVYGGECDQYFPDTKEEFYSEVLEDED